MDWGYLFSIMEPMDFDHQWIVWMKMCVTTVNYSILMDDDIVGPIIPSRGLRQHDPLSPYLYTLSVEGLTSLLKRQKEEA